MPSSIESRLGSKSTTEPITIADFKTEMFDNRPMKTFAPREVIEAKGEPPYYQIPPERLKA